MILHFDAIFEDGVFRPLRPVALPDHSRVSVTVSSPELQPGGVNGCAGTITAEAAAEMTSIVEREFEGVDLREW